MENKINAISEQESMQSKDALETKYREVSKERGRATDLFFEEVNRLDSETGDHTDKIDEDLLAAYFLSDSTKPQLAKDNARTALRQLRDFRTTVVGMTTSVAALSLNLKLTHDSLLFGVVEQQIRHLAAPPDIDGARPLEIAKQGLQSIKSAHMDGERAYTSVLSDVILLEQQTCTNLQLAVLVLQTRRQHLWEFRQQNLTVTRAERLARAKKYGKEAGSEELSDALWGALATALEAIVEEFEDISWIKRTKRWGAVVLKLAGHKDPNSRENDTDLVLKLLGRLKTEHQLLKNFEAALETANEAICAVRDNNRDGFGGALN